MRFIVEIPNTSADFGLAVLKTLSFVKKAEPVENAVTKKTKKLLPPHIDTSGWKFNRDEANER